MFRIEKISAPDAPELAPYRAMRRSAEHEAQGIFIAEGEKVTRRLLESRFTVVSLVLPEKHLENFRPLLEARPETVTVYLVEKELLETITGFSLFQGVMAVGQIPLPASLDDILQKSPAPSSLEATTRQGSKLLVAVDELANAENLGALVRNCVAFGVHGLIVGETSTSPFLRRSVRNSMGTIFQLPVWEIKMANDAVQLRRDTPPQIFAGTDVKRFARTRRPLHRRASARERKSFVAGKFFRRLLHRLRQRRQWYFQNHPRSVRRMRGDPDGERRGFPQRRRGGGGVSLRSRPPTQEGLKHQDPKPPSWLFFVPW